MKRLRGCIWLTAGAVIALLAGVVGFITLTQATARQSGAERVLPEVQVVVAARDVTVRSRLAAEDVVLKAISVDTVPEGALRDTADAVDKITLTDLYAGEIILRQRLVEPNLLTANGRYALLVAEDQVLMALPAVDLMSRIGILKPGDHVDLLFSLEFPTAAQVIGIGGAAQVVEGEEKQVTWNLLQNLTVAAIVGGQTPSTGSAASAPQALLLTVSPQDALVLKYVIDAGAIADLVVRAPGVERPFSVEPVDINYVIDRYAIPTGPGE